MVGHYCPAKQKGNICLLYKLADNAFLLCGEQKTTREVFVGMALHGSTGANTYPVGLAELTMESVFNLFYYQVKSQLLGMNERFNINICNYLKLNKYK